MTLLQLNAKKKRLQNQLRLVNKRIKEAQYGLPRTRTKKIFTQNDYKVGDYVQTFDFGFWCKILDKDETGLSIEVDGEPIRVSHDDVKMMKRA